MDLCQQPCDSTKSSFKMSTSYSALELGNTFSPVSTEDRNNSQHYCALLPCLSLKSTGGTCLMIALLRMRLKHDYGLCWECVGCVLRMLSVCTGIQPVGT